MGAKYLVHNNLISFEGVLFSLDGEQKIEVQLNGIELSEFKDLGKRCAQEILSTGGRELMKEIKAELK